VGVSVHDGKSFPQEAKAIQYMDLSPYKIIGAGFTTTPMYVDFQQKVMELAHYVAKAVSAAPAFTDWPVTEAPAPDRPLDPGLHRL
jgi:hypothetical protein